MCVCVCGCGWVCVWMCWYTGYAGAGLYDSIPMHMWREEPVSHFEDALLSDEEARRALLEQARANLTLTSLRALSPPPPPSQWSYCLAVVSWCCPTDMGPTTRLGVWAHCPPVLYSPLGGGWACSSQPSRAHTHSRGYRHAAPLASFTAAATVPSLPSVQLLSPLALSQFLLPMVS